MRVLLLCALIIYFPLLSVGQAALGQQDAYDETTSNAWIEARRLYLAEDFEAARAKIEEVISAEPSRYDTWQAWVATYRPGPRLDESEQELMRRLAVDANNPQLLFARGLVARYSGKLDQARGWFVAATKLDPRSEVIPLEHYECFPQKDPRAKQLLEKTLQLNPGNLRVINEWIRFQLVEEGRPADAIEAQLRLKYAQGEATVVADFAVGISSYYRQPNTESHKQLAVELLRKVVQARPTAAIAWSGLATLYRQLRQFDQAAQAVERGQAIAWWQAIWLDKLEYLTYDRDGAEAALEQSRRFVKCFPDSWRAWNSLGLDLSAVGQKEEAIDAFRKSIERDWWQEYATPRWNLAHNLSQADRHREALLVYLNLLDVDPAYLSQRDVPAAIIRNYDDLTPDDHDLLDQWTKGKVNALPEAAWPQLMRARIAAAREQYESAAQLYAAIIQRFPGNAATAMTYWGQMLAQQQEYSLAKDQFLDALKRDLTHMAAFDALNELIEQDTLPDEVGDDLILRFRQLVKEHPTNREPLVYLARSLETLASRRGNHQLYELALVPRLKLCSLQKRDDEKNDTVQKQDYEQVAALYAALGDFDAAFLFYQRAGKESYREAVELLSTASKPLSSYPFREQRKREEDSRPQVFDSLNSVELAEGNKVNLQNANFVLAQVDSTSGPNLLEVERYYNSRSCDRGLFGYGWMTLFETHLGLNEETNKIEVLTQSGFTVKFETSVDYHQRIIDEIIRRRNSIGKSVTDEFRTRLADKLALMNEAEQAKVLGPKVIDVRAIPQWHWLIKTADEPRENRHGRLYVEGKQLVFYHAESKSTFYWDRDGDLIAISHPVLGHVELEYADDRLTDVIDCNSGDWVKLRYNDAGKVIRVISSDGRDARYIYSSAGECLASRNANGEVHGFLYDKWQNLTAIRFPSGRTQRMLYHTRRKSETRDPRDWIISVESSEGNLRYAFDANFYPGYKQGFYDVKVRCFWMGKPMSVSTTTYKHFTPDNSTSNHKETRFAGLQRELGENVYKLSYNPLDEHYSDIVIDRKRSMLEWDESGRPVRILKPDGSVIHFSYDDDGDEAVLKSIQTGSGTYQFHFAHGRVTNLSGPRGFHAQIVRESTLPVSIDNDDWSIELIRDSSDHLGHIVDYRLRLDGNWRSIGRDKVERVHRAMNAKKNAWTTGQPINWTEDSHSADLAFVLARLEQLYDALSRSTLPEHALDCPGCFPGYFRRDLSGYDLELFEKVYLPKFR